jgi:flavin-dependent thymidylate synthase
MVKVTLLSWTNKPEDVIYTAFMNMHNKIPDELMHISKKEFAEFYDIVMSQPHTTVLEFVNTVWKIDGVSRASQQQITRSRDAAYSIQSLRIVKVENFYDNHAFTESSYVKSHPEIHKRYHDTMMWLEHQYQQLIELGCPTEDARGILPLNIHSPITMAINLRSLYHMLNLRLCKNSQEEYREVAQQIKKEIETKMSPVIAKYIRPICFETGKCPSLVPCDEYPKIPKTNKKDVSKYIKG